MSLRPMHPAAEARYAGSHTRGAVHSTMVPLEDGDTLGLEYLLVPACGHRRPAVFHAHAR
jgi:hypothetical protein